MPGDSGMEDARLRTVLRQLCRAHRGDRPLFIWLQAALGDMPGDDGADGSGLGATEVYGDNVY